MILKTTIHGLVTAIKGLFLTIHHLAGASKNRKEYDIRKENYFDKQEGVVTLQYPKEKISITEVARYQLQVDIDDCIVCDLCAKACPVDCIDITAIKSPIAIGKTSDGSVKRLYAEKFDIDMAKCMYCGLCTVVCPTECIIMTDQYEKTATNLSELTYGFAEMSAQEIDQRKKEWAAHEAINNKAKGLKNT